MASISRRYSQALVGLCNKDKSHEQVATELTRVVEALAKHPDIASALQSPAVSQKTRKKVVAQIASDLNLRTLTTNFLFYLNDKQRMDHLSDILRSFREQLDERSGRIRAQVRAAEALSALDRAKLQKTLERATGKKVVLETSVDPALVGGVVTKVGNIVLDGSVRTQLDKMKEQLLAAVR